MSGVRPTLDTVARAAGVSRMTVSNAYNRPDQLSAATRERVLAAAAELGYPGPDPAGRSLRRGRAGAVGVLLSEDLSAAFTDAGLVSFLDGIADELSKAGQAMLLIPPEADIDGSLVRGAIVDAFITCSVEADNPSVIAVIDRRLPLVAAGSPRLEGVPTVGIDNRRGGAAAAEHLLELGHRRFGVVLAPEHSPSTTRSRATARVYPRQRYDGFVDAVREAGLPASAVRSVTAPRNSLEGGRTAGAALLTGSPRRRPTAVFAVTDMLALGVLDAASDARLRVPRDLSVVGFDDIPAASHSHPPLTTMSQSLRGQGQHAARMALAMIAGRRARVPVVTSEVVVRGTTAPPTTP